MSNSLFAKFAQECQIPVGLEAPSVAAHTPMARSDSSQLCSHRRIVENCCGVHIGQHCEWGSLQRIGTTNTQARDTSSRHRSSRMTQEVAHAHGNRAAQNSGALGLSSAEVTILMQSNADNREIVTLPPGGATETCQPRCVCYLKGMITSGTF
jgi:hypothetical protein